MALTIMGGLFVATFLTVLFLPALYATWFRRHLNEGKPPKSKGALAPDCRTHDLARGGRGMSVATEASGQNAREMRAANQESSETAERLFREIGFQKTTVADIARELAHVSGQRLSLLRLQSGDPRGGRP